MKKKAGTWADTLSEDEVNISREKFNQISTNNIPIDFKMFAEKTFLKLSDRQHKRSFDETDNIKSALFEIRVGSELFKSQRCSEIKYELEAGVRNTTIDFKFRDNHHNIWFLELTSLRESQRVKDKTWSKDGHFGYLGDADDETAEILRVQGILHQKVWDEKKEKPIKFPEPKRQTFNVIVINMLAFLNSGSVESDHNLICYGNDSVGLGFRSFVEGQPLAGVFQERHPEASLLKTLRERVHFIMFVNETGFGKSIAQQHYTCCNPTLFSSLKEARTIWDYFPLC